MWEYRLRKHHRLSDKIRPIISPLIEAFDIAQFCYFYVDEKGMSACLSSHPQWVEFYLYQNLFLYNPFLKDPKIVPEGVFFAKGIRDKGFQESQKHAKAFGIEDTIILTSKEDGLLKGFSFGLSPRETNYSLFVNELPLLKRFCSEFEKRASKQIAELEPVDVRDLLKGAFYKKLDSQFLSSKNRDTLVAHLNIPKLSKREQECLGLYLKGETAKSIGEILDISNRTVESYLVNIKCKLNCENKTELIKKSKDLILQ